MSIDHELENRCPKCSAPWAQHTGDEAVTVCPTPKVEAKDDLTGMTFVEMRVELFRARERLSILEGERVLAVEALARRCFDAYREERAREGNPCPPWEEGAENHRERFRAIARMLLVRP